MSSDKLLMSTFAYRVFLEEMGIIHWLTLDHIAKPWRDFVASQPRRTSVQKPRKARKHSR